MHAGPGIDLDFYTIQQVVAESLEQQIFSNHAALTVKNKPKAKKEAQDLAILFWAIDK